MAKKKIKVLYFLQGARPTEADDEAILEFTAKHQVCFRNAKFIRDDDAIEDFDVVAGAVPPIYAKAAELKGPPIELKRPKTPAKGVDAKSPAAPQDTPQDAATDATAGDASKADDASKEAAPGDAKPVTPAPPQQAKGWKPNA